MKEILKKIKLSKEFVFQLTHKHNHRKIEFLANRFGYGWPCESELFFPSLIDITNRQKTLTITLEIGTFIYFHPKSKRLTYSTNNPIAAYPIVNFPQLFFLLVKFRKKSRKF